jgi:chromosome segregation ATPase
MSLVLLKSFVSEITSNNAKMAQNKKDIDDIKEELKANKVEMKNSKDKILALQAIDVIQDALDLDAIEELKSLQNKIASLKADIKKEKSIEVIKLQSDIVRLKAQLAALKGEDAPEVGDATGTTLDIVEILVA